MIVSQGNREHCKQWVHAGVSKSSSAQPFSSLSVNVARAGCREIIRQKVRNSIFLVGGRSNRKAGMISLCIGINFALPVQIKLIFFTCPFQLLCLGCSDQSVCWRAFLTQMPLLLVCC